MYYALHSSGIGPVSRFGVDSEKWRVGICNRVSMAVLEFAHMYSKSVRMP